MKIKINKEKCLRCGTCVSLYPEHFRFNDEGDVELINPENIPEEIMKEAVKICPGQAIESEEK